MKKLLGIVVLGLLLTSCSNKEEEEVLHLLLTPSPRIRPAARKILAWWPRIALQSGSRD